MSYLAHFAIFIGIIQMGYSIYISHKLSLSTKTINFQKRWKLVQILISFFLISYIALDVYIWRSHFSIFYLWISLVYCFGASFVLLMLLFARKSLETLVFKQKIFMNSIFSSLSHPLFIINTEKNVVTLANDAARTKISPDDEMTYDRICSLCCERDGLCPVQETQRTGRPLSINFTYNNPNNEKDERFFEISTYPIKTIKEIKEVIVSVIDITGRIKGERERSVNSMIVTYNHEINNPLTIALAGLEYQMRNLRDAQTKEGLEKVKTALKRIGNIVKKITDMGESKEINFDTYSDDSEMVRLDSEK